MGMIETYEDFRRLTDEEADKYVREAAQYAERTRVEAELFGAWVDKQQAKGRRDRLTFGDFVRETGVLRA